jgi:DNA-binding transcriptional MerR regulator
MATLPPKLYFRIGEVASLVGVEPHVLRYWEREFRSIRPTKSAKGQRVYSRRDVENLMRVRDLLYADGFTIAGAKKKLQRSGTEPDDRGVAQGVTQSTPEAEPTLITTPPAPDAPPGPSDGIHVRTALRELRSEIEALLAELGG